MDADKILENEPSEGIDLEYKGQGADPKDVAKELVSLANSGGGTLVYGVDYDDSSNQINSVEGISKPGEIKQRIIQHITSKVTPDLKYKFEESTLRNETVYIIRVSSADSILYSFEEDTDKFVFYKREGESKVMMDALSVSSFYRDDITPGAYSSTSKSPEERISNQFELDHETHSELPEMVFNRFRKTPNAWLFYPDFNFIPELEYKAESHYTSVDLDELEGIAATLVDIFGEEFAKGSYVHKQTNGSWIGSGLDNFLETLRKRDTRYKQAPDEHDLIAHHSEGNIYLVSTDQLTVMLNGQMNHSGGKILNHFYVSFVTAGVPFDSRKIHKFLDRTDLELKNGLETEGKYKEQVYFEDDEIEVNEVKRFTRKHADEEFVHYLIAENPFKDKKRALKNKFERNSFAGLAEQDKIFARLRTKHEVDANPSYFVRSLEVSNIGALGGNISAFNAGIEIDHNYYS